MEEETELEIQQRIKKSGLNECFPTTEEEADAVDDLLANELAELSLLEQDRVSFDVHGLTAEVEETEELIQTRLEEMEREIKKIKKKPAFEKAMQLNPNHVRSRELRIRFLRCTSFNSKNAAKRLIFHFEKKEMLFGDGEVLGRDIRLSDMSAEDMFHIESGAMQVLPTRDISGRSVLAWLPGNFKGDKYITKSSQRTFYYIVDTTSREEETQKKGFVSVFLLMGNVLTPNLGLLGKLLSIRLAMPHRMQGFHLCFDDEKSRPLVSGIRYFLDKRGRERFRVHFGDEQKVTFQLQTYGIPFDDESPLKVVNGQYSLAWHQQWLQIRQSQETPPSEGKKPVVIPHRFDVLFGRGRFVREHTGNLRAAHLVNMWQKKYDEAGRFEKTTIAEKLITIIHESGGKFLKREKSGWVDVDYNIARDKVSHWFRHNRQKQTESSSKESLEGTQKQKRPLRQAQENHVQIVEVNKQAGSAESVPK